MSESILERIHKEISYMYTTFDIKRKEMEVALPINEYVQLIAERKDYSGCEVYIPIDGSWVHISPQFNGVKLSRREAIILYEKINKIKSIKRRYR